MDNDGGNGVIILANRRYYLNVVVEYIIIPYVRVFSIFTFQFSKIKRQRQHFILAHC